MLFQHGVLRGRNHHKYFPFIKTRLGRKTLIRTSFIVWIWYLSIWHADTTPVMTRFRVITENLYSSWSDYQKTLPVFSCTEQGVGWHNLKTPYPEWHWCGIASRNRFWNLWFMTACGRTMLDTSCQLHRIACGISLCLNRASAPR